MIPSFPPHILQVVHRSPLAVAQGRFYPVVCEEIKYGRVVWVSRSQPVCCVPADSQPRGAKCLALGPTFQISHPPRAVGSKPGIVYTSHSSIVTMPKHDRQPPSTMVQPVTVVASLRSVLCSNLDCDTDGP